MDEMVNQDHLGGFMSGEHGDEATYYPELWTWLVEGPLQVRTVMDIGCGEGHSTKFFRDLGCKVTGIDGIEQEDRDITTWDFTKGIWPDLYPRLAPYDLIWMCEFVEHIEERYINNIIPILQVGKITLMTHAFPGQLGHHHVNCLVEGTLVASPGIKDAFRRWYVGEVITLVTSDGDELTVTPNHPIATLTGWSAAGLLQEGDDLLCGAGGDWVPRGMVPNSYDAPLPVEEVFRTLEKVSPSGALSMPSTPEEFHGDGMDGEVDVVRTNGQLGFGLDSALVEHRAQEVFSLGAMSAESLASNRTLGLGLVTIGSASTSGVKIIHPSGTFKIIKGGPAALIDLSLREGGEAMTLDDSLDSRPGHAVLLHDGGQVVGFDPGLDNGVFVDVESDAISLRSDSNPLANEKATGSSIVDMGFLGDLSKRLSRSISIKKLARIHRSDYAGHVYNLSTDEGCYWADGIVTHNCRTQEYWLGFMAAAGPIYSPGLTTKTREIAAANLDPYNHYKRSGLAFRRNV